MLINTRAARALRSAAILATLGVVGGTASAFLTTTTAVVSTFSCDNLVVNGSFEDPNMGTGWSVFSTIPGWTRVSAAGFEVGWFGLYGVSGHDGNQVIELDGHANSRMKQDVTTTGGASYSFSFLAAKRGGTADASNQIKVYVDGALLDTINPTSATMTEHSYTVMGDGTTPIEFEGGGTQDSLGSMIDDVRLTAVYSDDVTVLYDQTKLHKSGSTIPVKIQVAACDGTNLSSDLLVVSAVGVQLVGGAGAGDPEDAGNANPDSNFRYSADLSGYIFNLKTTGLAAGTYELQFTIGDESLVRTVEFRVK